jgi:hypothetical protein
MKHAFFKWFLHNRKNDIMRFQKNGSMGKLVFAGEWRLYDESIH